MGPVCVEYHLSLLPAGSRWGVCAGSPSAWPEHPQTLNQGMTQAKATKIILRYLSRLTCQCSPSRPGSSDASFAFGAPPDASPINLRT